MYSIYSKSELGRQMNLDAVAQRYRAGLQVSKSIDRSYNWGMFCIQIRYISTLAMEPQTRYFKW